MLHASNIGTLLFDLLTNGEDSNHENRFNISLLSKRLKRATEWLADYLKKKEYSFGYFGASTGAAAAIEAACKTNVKIKAIVPRGGRIDLARDYLHSLKAPAVLIVGEKDEDSAIVLYKKLVNA